MYRETRKRFNDDNRLRRVDTFNRYLSKKERNLSVIKLEMSTTRVNSVIQQENDMYNWK